MKQKQYDFSKAILFCETRKTGVKVNQSENILLVIYCYDFISTINMFRAC